MLRRVVSNLSSSRSLRRIVIPVLERFNLGDIRLRHHYTGRRFLLHSFRHKGYWFHGQLREQATMQFFQAMLRPGDTVIEVGGHIGYLSMYFANLVAPGGRVVVFEPGQNNLPYIRSNLEGLPSVELLEFAVSDTNGTATFFEEPLTGQNNSLLRDYEVFAQNRALAFSESAYQERTVQTTRLDTFVEERSLIPTLIKIDIEGAEYMALSGALETLAAHKPMLMVEVTERASDVFELLAGAGYRLFTPDGGPIENADAMHGNVCGVHLGKHRDRLESGRWAKSHAA